MKAAAITFLLLVCVKHNIHAQAEPYDYKAVTDKFVTYYNQGTYKSIFGMCDSLMQKFSPLDKSNAFFEMVKTHTGQIITNSFQKYKAEVGAVYKLTCEKSIFKLNITVDKQEKISSYTIIPYPPDSLPMLARNTTLLQLPFKGEWTVVWGGDTKELNPYFDSRAEKKAFDMCITDKNGATHKKDGKNNKDYYAFGEKTFAPCDGEVVSAVDDIQDNKPGIINTANPSGNSVILKTANNEYLVFSHFKMGSVEVQYGQKVKRGDLLGLCGNSGKSSEPHLHFHIQNVEDMSVATGVKCYFDKLLVNGELKTGYSPVKGDKIERTKE